MSHGPTDEKSSTTLHVSPSGDKFTREVIRNGATTIEIIRNACGQQISMNGSGGRRPWE